nr:MAG TPA: hypothetical protein [Caudoviricetes sp.]
MRYAHFELFNFEFLGLYKKDEGQTLSQRLPFQQPKIYLYE